MDKEYKERIQKEMRKYNPNFVAYEYLYNTREGKLGEITSQNLAGAYVRYLSKSGEVWFMSHWIWRECVAFQSEQEFLVWQIKNS
jgi:hypothetical protein